MKRAISLEAVNSSDGALVSQQSKKVKTSKATTIMCLKCFAPCKVTDAKCDYCLLYCHLSCCGLTLKGAKLDAIVDVLQVVGWTCGTCKFMIKTLLQSGPAPSSTSTKEQEKKMDSLTHEVKELKKQSKLAQQSAPVSGISQSSCGSRDSSEGCAWTDVRATISKTVKDVYKRSRNFVVTGLSDTNDSQVYNSTRDVNAIKNLCTNELGINPTVTMTRRLGRSSGSAPRRLLVTLSCEQEVVCILRECRRLRKSADKTIAQHIYINPDLSPDDAKKAFEVRKARRETAGGSANPPNYQAQTGNNMNRQVNASSRPHGSSLSAQNFPPLSSASTPLYTPAFQSLQNPATRNNTSLSPSATPFVATTHNVSSHLSAVDSATLLPACSLPHGIIDTAVDTSSTINSISN